MKKNIVLAALLIAAVAFAFRAQLFDDSGILLENAEADTLMLITDQDEPYRTYMIKKAVEYFFTDTTSSVWSPNNYWYYAKFGDYILSFGDQDSRIVGEIRLQFEGADIELDSFIFDGGFVKTIPQAVRRLRKVMKDNGGK